MPASRSFCATGHAEGPWAMATASGSPSLELIKAFLGPFPARGELDAEEMEQVDCGSYIRWKIRYSVAPGERVTAFVCVPKEAETPTAAVFCHHQHAGKFALGKSEVVGLAGDPDQAYASELAEQGFITIAPDAIGFEERNWSPDRSENISWFELSTRLVRGQTLLAFCLHDISVASTTSSHAQTWTPSESASSDTPTAVEQHSGPRHSTNASRHPSPTAGASPTACRSRTTPAYRPSSSSRASPSTTT